jgi:CubicO group peptidase (beta-lactamase class C family)
MNVLTVLLAMFATTPVVLPQDDPKRFEMMIDGALASLANDPAAPGGVIAISRDGAIVAERGFGMANLDHDIRNTPDTVFDIGSTSKQFTAAAIVLLGLEEKLSLDDSLRDHLPELPEAYADITLRHLMHHTSGIRDYLPLLALDGKPDSDHTTASDALAALARQDGLCFEPGTFHEYSNSGYFLMAQVVERVTGESFAKFAAERFFQPLGMKDSHVHDDCTVVVKRRATSYEPLPDGQFAQHTSSYEQTGDGAVMTTVRDLLAWADNFRTGKVGGDEFRTAMGSRGALDGGTSLAYGMGLMHDTVPAGSAAIPVISHGGAWAASR